MKKWKNRQKINTENLFETEPETVLVSANTESSQSYSSTRSFNIHFPMPVVSDFVPVTNN